MRCQRIVQRINSHCHQGSTNEQRLTKNIVSSLARSLQDLSSNFRRAQSSYLRSMEFLWRSADMYCLMLYFCMTYLTASSTVWVQLFSCILLASFDVLGNCYWIKIMPCFIWFWSSVNHNKQDVVSYKKIMYALKNKNSYTSAGQMLIIIIKGIFSTNTSQHTSNTSEYLLQFDCIFNFNEVEMA